MKKKKHDAKEQNDEMKYYLLIIETLCEESENEE